MSARARKPQGDKEDHNEMRTVTIARALKEKERVARNLKRARELFARVNSVPAGTKRPVDAKTAFEDVQRLQNRYLELKKAIAATNADISAQLTEMLVVRAEKEFYERLECKEISSFDEWEDMADGSRIRRPVNTPYDAYIDEAKRREMVESLEERLDSLQDEVDAFNATHTLEVAM